MADRLEIDTNEPAQFASISVCSLFISDAATPCYIQTVSGSAYEARAAEGVRSQKLFRSQRSPLSVRKGAMQPMQRETVTGTIGRSRVYFLMAQNNRVASIHFSDPLP